MNVTFLTSRLFGLCGFLSFEYAITAIVLSFLGSKNCTVSSKFHPRVLFKIASSLNSRAADIRGCLSVFSLPPLKSSYLRLSLPCASLVKITYNFPLGLLYTGKTEPDLLLNSAKLNGSAFSNKYERGFPSQEYSLLASPR